MRSGRQLAAAVAGPPSGILSDVYANLLAEVARAPGGRSLETSLTRRLNLRHPASMLETKALLAAVRLAARPAALILDEPDWGLNRSEALALTAAVIRAAHRFNVPVLLISHKPWWGGLGASQLRVCKHRTAGPDEARDMFRIGLEVGEGAAP
jgi:hypothetical protein